MVVIPTGKALRHVRLEDQNLTHDQRAMIEAHKAGRAAAGKLTTDQAHLASRAYGTAEEGHAYYAGYRGERIRQGTWEGGR